MLKTHNKDKYYKNFMVLLSGNTISQLFPFIIAPIISRIYKPEEFAVQANFLAIVSLIGIVSAGRFELALVLPKENRKAQHLFWISVSIAIGFSILSYILYFFRIQIGQMYNDTMLVEYIYLVPLALLFLGLYNILLNWILRFKKFNLISFNRIIQSSLGNILYALLGYWGWGIDGLVWGWIIAQMVSALFFLLPGIKMLEKHRYDIKETKELIYEYKDFPTINSLHAFTDILATQFLIFWLITNEFGMLVLGLFSMMNRYLRAPIQLVSYAVSQIYYKEASENKYNKISVMPILKKSLKISFFFAIPFILIVLAWGPELFAWYLGEQWRDAGVYARILAPALFLNFLSSPISGTPLIFSKQKKAFLWGLFTYALSLGALFLFAWSGYDFEITLYGYSAALSISYLGLILWYLQIVKKYDEANCF